jgi:uncharacterized protein YrrD
MEFREGMSVVSSDGKTAGKLNRVVIDPGTKEVSHIVVQKGRLLPADKVVPIALIEKATENAIMLKPEAGNLREMPSFERTLFVGLDDSELGRTGYPAAYVPGFYWYPPYGMPGYSLRPYYEIPFGLTIIAARGGAQGDERSIPENAVALREGAAVFGSDGKRAGDVDEVLTGAGDHVTHLVLARGVLKHSRKLVPIHWVGRIEDDDVHLKVGSEFVKGLPDYPF